MIICPVSQLMPSIYISPFAELFSFFTSSSCLPPLLPSFSIYPPVSVPLLLPQPSKVYASYLLLILLATPLPIPIRVRMPHSRYWRKVHHRCAPDLHALTVTITVTIINAYRTRVEMSVRTTVSTGAYWIWTKTGIRSVGVGVVVGVGSSIGRIIEGAGCGWNARRCSCLIEGYFWRNRRGLRRWSASSG